MAFNFKFDLSNNILPPSLVLMTKSGRKLGSIPAKGVSFSGGMNKASELYFYTHKYNNGAPYHLWNDLKSLRLIYSPEWNQIFEATVETNISDDTKKNVSAKSLGEVELSQINLYDVHINTEEDIARDDYVITRFYDPINPSGSLLNRIMEKAPHYVIEHVDNSIANLQRTFSFDNKNIYDTFQEISEEIECLFDINVCLDSVGKLKRTVSVYDLKSYCYKCGKRGDFLDVCPECGSKDISTGYGEDTSISISKKNLSNEITCSENSDSVKNCFKLEAGDDYMTSVISTCNPNGGSYIWNITDEMMEDMSQELIDRLKSYNDLSELYLTKQFITLNDLVFQYNEIVRKYASYTDDLEELPEEICGYSKLMEFYYNTIDLYYLLNNSLMPNIKIQDTNAEKEAAKLTSENIGKIAVSNLDTCSSTTASSAALSIAKTIVDPRYQVKVKSGVLSNSNWIGNFSIVNYSDEEDTAESFEIAIPVTDDYETFIKQKIEKTLSNKSEDAADISAIFKLENDEFAKELNKYSLVRLKSFYDACQACLNIMVEQGVSNKDSSDADGKLLYDSMYVPYYTKLTLIEAEIKEREADIKLVIGSYDENGILLSDGIQTRLEKERSSIQQQLNFEAYLGEKLWLELLPYRREDIYKNDNYISDGLTNSEIIQNAIDFIEAAKEQILKVGNVQHTISGSLKNLLAMKEFKPIVNQFSFGNWLRIEVGGKIYRLRLIGYNIDFDNLDNIVVEFSDVIKAENSVSDIKSILNQASTVSSSFSYVAHQATKAKTESEALSELVGNGLSLTKTKIFDNASKQNHVFDQNGMIFRKYDEIDDSYDPCQLKIINSTMAITSDNWRSVDTAIGKIYYIDPKTGEQQSAYGINAGLILGKIILGQSLGIYNSSGNMTFDDDGFIISNDINSFNVNPNATNLLTIRHGDDMIFGVTENGELYIKCDGTDVNMEGNVSITTLNEALSSNKEAIESESGRAKNAEDVLKEEINSVSVEIIKEVNRAQKAENSISSSLSKLITKVANIEKFIEKTHPDEWKSFNSKDSEEK